MKLIVGDKVEVKSIFTECTYTGTILEIRHGYLALILLDFSKSLYTVHTSRLKLTNKKSI